MKAVVFEAPFTVSVKQVSDPRDESLVEGSDEAIVQVEFAGLCGSDLHAFRGNELLPGGGRITLGHEFVGRVIAHALPRNTENGSNNDSVTNTNAATSLVGRTVLAPFTTSCLRCTPCEKGFTSRCVSSALFGGSEKLQGAQAEFVRVPNASGTLIDIETLSNKNSVASKLTFSKESLLLCCDILPTGYYAALQALTHQNLHGVFRGISLTDYAWNPVAMPDASLLTPKDSLIRSPLTFAVVGLGPVGTCALIALIDILLHPRDSPLRIPTPSLVLDRDLTFLLIDGVARRRDLAVKIFDRIKKTCNSNASGASFFKNAKVVALDVDQAAVWTKSRKLDECVDAALEAVGSSESLKLCYHILRPFGVISSIGVHTSPTFPLTGDDLYNKNVALNFGRCPVRAVLPLALKTLERRQDVFETFASTDPDGIGLIDRVVPVEDAAEMYDAFEKRKVGKVLFKF
ncbi:hypothetical protein HK100_007582 [Physocladia obscura]|uniref:Alcohol dehydrogenase-like N-terminal domain-containing protein n=1 Tax=Physocladia obscura TaxID=109957 RepID=A0AAD5SP88_9FUNG|nr:hypothetical protein HK100_007582 [Physocladia obscura]